ncbi:MAG TPA: rhomboid family intramembrane serine protease [Bacteroidales bacterium]|nr:rhomboid family intramembrane serine protease [Bacteroidales bacterium]
MTYILIAFTALISIPAFNNQNWFLKLQFNPYQVYYRREFYRLLTHGFLHANWTHLIINMLVLFFFGPHVESTLKSILGPEIQQWHRLIYLLFYFAAIIIASLISLFRHKDDVWYNAVGASGAVSAVIFFFIFFNPWEMLYFYGILPVPGIIMGALYLIYSQVMSRRGTDNVNHDAHFVGALFGFLFPLIINYRLIGYFIDQLLSFSF